MRNHSPSKFTDRGSDCANAKMEEGHQAGDKNANSEQTSGDPKYDHSPDANARTSCLCWQQ